MTISGWGSNSVSKVPATHAGRPEFRLLLFRKMPSMVTRTCASPGEAVTGGLLKLTGLLT